MCVMARDSAASETGRAEIFTAFLPSSLRVERASQALLRRNAAVIEGGGGGGGGLCSSSGVYETRRARTGSSCYTAPR